MKIGPGRAVLISKHGAVGVGTTLDEAFEMAVKIEEIAYLYLLSQQFAAISERSKEETS